MIGIGAFFCALGVMHFLETYLASVAYVSLPFGIVASPGSTVLFTGKLMLLLLVYIHEDAVVVRQPIYGLLVGNILLVMLAYLMRNHALMAISPERVADLGFLNEMGVLMVWGTGILFIDCILIILLYEKSRAWFGQQVFARLAVSGAVVLTFDQIAFFAGLHVLTGAGLSVLIGGWVAKMGAVAVYTDPGRRLSRLFRTPAADRTPAQARRHLRHIDLSRALRRSARRNQQDGRLELGAPPSPPRALLIGEGPRSARPRVSGDPGRHNEGSGFPLTRE